MQIKNLVHIIILSVSCLLFTTNASADAWNNWGRWASGIGSQGTGGIGGSGSGGCEDYDDESCNQEETLQELLAILEEDEGFPLFALALFGQLEEEDEEFEEFLEEFGEILFIFFDAPELFGLIFGEFDIGIDTERGSLSFVVDEELEELLTILASLPSGFSDGELSTGPLALISPDVFGEEGDIEGVNSVFFPFGGGEFHTVGFFAFLENDHFGFGPFVTGDPTDNMAELVGGDVIGFYEGGGFGFGTAGLAFWILGMEVDFGNLEWGGGFLAVEGDCAVCEFGAEGTISGANFSSTEIFGEGDTTGFVEGSFFGTDAPELGGRFEVSNEEGTDKAVFSACDGDCEIIIIGP